MFWCHGCPAPWSLLNRQCPRLTGKSIRILCRWVRWNPPHCSWTDNHLCIRCSLLNSSQTMRALLPVWVAWWLCIRWWSGFPCLRSRLNRLPTMHSSPPGFLRSICPSGWCQGWGQLQKSSHQRWRCYPTQSTLHRIHTGRREFPWKSA